MSDFSPGVRASIFVFAGCLEWLAIGKLIEDRLVHTTFGACFVQKIDPYSVLAILAIILLASVAVPLTNNRSRHAGFRHGAIWFD